MNSDTLKYSKQNSPTSNLVVALAIGSSSIFGIAQSVDIVRPEKARAYQSSSKYPWEASLEAHYISTSNDVEYQAIVGFASKMLENSKDIEPTFSQIIEENFWDLI